MSRNPAFNVGQEDFKKGNLDNPYKKETIAFKEWQAGFDHQYFLNQKANLNLTKDI